MRENGFTFVEFFSGAGMARLGFGEEWNCILANDIDHKKCKTYRKNFPGRDVLIEGDIANISGDMIKQTPDLVWASFPCQDISIAGKGFGLEGSRSSTYWQVWRILSELYTRHRRPNITVLENVEALLSIHNGDDLRAILRSLIELDYYVCVLSINAYFFVPQSRPRIFIIAMGKERSFSHYEKTPYNHPFFSDAVFKFLKESEYELRNNWKWLRLPPIEPTDISLQNIIIDDFSLSIWNSTKETERLLGMMNDANRKKIEDRIHIKGVTIGTLYKRTRMHEGKKIQRAEARFDNIAGALRTPAGGSSRQSVIVIKNGEIRTRLILPREAARLMGIPDSYNLPERYNEAYHLMGDGVVVPVVRWLREAVFTPFLKEIQPPDFTEPQSTEVVYA